MMFGRFNKLLLLTIVFGIVSCKETKLNPIYKDIPPKYDYVFRNIRALDNSSIVNVKSSNGLIDRLSLDNYSKEKKYAPMFTNYGVPGAEDQKFYVEFYDQTLNPNLYQFYYINYFIDFYNRETYETPPQDVENYYAGIKIKQKTIFQIGLINSNIITKYPYQFLDNYVIDGSMYSNVYSIDISDANGANDINKVFFNIESGVLQFETNSSEVFNISL